MSDVSKNYSAIVTDDTHFVKPFSSELKNLLLKMQIYCAETFVTERTYSERRLAGNERAIFAENNRFLDGCQLKTLSGQDQQLFHLRYVLETLAQNAKHSGERYLYVTSDHLRMMWVILKKLPIDVYDVAVNRLIHHEEFDTFAQEHYLFPWEMGKPYHDEPVKTADTSRENLTLYNEAGQPVVLRRTRFSGREAVIYETDGSSDRYKIFLKSETFSKKKIENIMRLKALWNRSQTCRDWSRFPIECVYLEPECLNIVGYRMKGEIDEKKRLDWLQVYDKQDNAVKLSLGVDMLEKLTWQLMFLSVYGFYAYDYGRGNFAFASGWLFCIMMDTDSLFCSDYSTEYGSPEFENPLIFVQGTTGKMAALTTCFLMTYVFAAWTLMRRYGIVNSRRDYNGNLDKFGYLIPEQVRGLLKEVLCEENLKTLKTAPAEANLPFYDALLYRLDQAKADLAEHDITYDELDRQEAERTPQKGPEKPQPKKPEPDKQETVRNSDSGNGRSVNGSKPIHREPPVRDLYRRRLEPSPPYAGEYHAPAGVFVLPARPDDQPLGNVARPEPSNGYKQSKVISPAPLRNRHPHPDANPTASTRPEKRDYTWLTVFLLTALLVALLILFFVDVDWIALQRDNVVHLWEWLVDGIVSFFKELWSRFLPHSGTGPLPENLLRW